MYPIIFIKYTVDNFSIVNPKFPKRLNWIIKFNFFLLLLYDIRYVDL